MTTKSVSPSNMMNTEKSGVLALSGTITHSDANFDKERLLDYKD